MTDRAYITATATMCREAEVAAGKALQLARNARHAIMRAYDGQGVAPACLALSEVAVSMLGTSENAMRYARMEFEKNPPQALEDAT